MPGRSVVRAESKEFFWKDGKARHGKSMKSIRQAMAFLGSAAKKPLELANGKLVFEPPRQL
jgi:hypothetical protein